MITTMFRRIFAVLAITTVSSSITAAQSLPSQNAPLRPGDRLLVKVWLDTTFADTVRIDSHRTAILPRVGPLSLEGVAADAAADSVRQAYSRIVRTPSIEVTPLRRVTVLGSVRKPGLYFLETRSTIRDAIAMAGGIDDIGATSHVVVLRDSTRTVVRDWERRSDETTALHSSDVIWIDREPWIKRNIFSVVSGVGVLFSVIYSVVR